jgi:hypothetical protein
MIAPTGVSLMPIDPQVVFQSLGDPPGPGSTEVRVSGDIRRGFGWFKGPSIPSASAKPFEVGHRGVIDVGCLRLQRLPSGARDELALRLILVGDREEFFEVDDVIQAIERFGKEITP